MDFKKIDIKVKRLVDSLFVWNYKTAFKWRWLEFSDFRQYDFWDDAKYIDFVASKREWKLLIKRYEEERELNVFFLLDLSESMKFAYDKKSKIDTLIEIFYILSFSAITNNDKIWALIFNEKWFILVSPKKWKNNLMKIIHIIQNNSIKEIKDFNVNKLFSFFNSLKIKNSLVFLLTDKTDEVDEKNLKIQSFRNDFVYINIFDYVENNLFSNDIIKLWFWRKVFFINWGNNKKIEEYKSLRKEKLKNFKNKLSKYKIDYLFFDDKTNIFKELLKFFKSR